MLPAAFVKSITSLEDLPEEDRPQVAMIGRSNVGKSSFVNHLTGQKVLARVSSQPGRTQTINFYRIDRRFFLVDLPGYGYAKPTKTKRVGFSDMIHDYLGRAPNLALVLLIVDAYVGPTELDLETLAFLRSLNRPVAIVAGKIDKLTPSKASAFVKKLAKEYPDVQVLPHSITTAKYRSDIWKAIEAAVKPLL